MPENESRKFRSAFIDAQRGTDTDSLPPKYTSSKRVYPRLSRCFAGMRRHLKPGSKILDFGTAHGGMVILGELRGYEMYGLDIKYAYREKNELSRYFQWQENLREDGYRIFSEDTSIYPWSFFEDNQFDAVFASYAINKFAGGFDPAENPRELRVAELIRVSKPGATWFLTPIGHKKLASSIIDTLVDKGISEQKDITVRKV